MLDKYVDVPDVIEPAKSGRSRCKGCGRSIAGGELRFGESVANPYAEGETLVWFHLVCAACMRPEKLHPTLETNSAPIRDREWLQRTALVGMAHRRLPRLLRAERASVGRARCRLCRDLIGKGCWRVALQMFEEGRMNSIGTIHVECAEAYLGTANVFDRIIRLTDGLSPTDRSEIESLLQKQRPAPDLPDAAGASPVSASLGSLEQGRS